MDQDQHPDQADISVDAEAPVNRYSPLSAPPWPCFPIEGVQLPASMAASLYQATYGLTTVVRLLQQSTRLRHNLETYEGETDYPLSPFDEGNLWCALTGLTEHLTHVIENLIARVGDDIDVHQAD